LAQATSYWTQLSTVQAITNDMGYYATSNAAYYNNICYGNPAGKR
jgi:hypothetical protein